MNKAKKAITYKLFNWDQTIKRIKEMVERDKKNKKAEE